MSKFLVLDVVFYGGSLNYDQGSGNYQELKKVTKWDGKQYTLVSRYALRYSILETAKRMGLWKTADADNLQKAGDGNKTVIQPSTELLLTGKILNYPEFDLFGYLITSTSPQNFREAPVKISHAISMTPFAYDVLFNANIGLANRMREKYGEMTPNPFTSEEHQTFYQYSIVIDVDRIGEIEVYLQKRGEIGLTDEKEKWKVDTVQKSENGIEIKLRTKKGEKVLSQVKECSSDIVELEKVYLLRYRLNDGKVVKDRIIQLIKTILNLKRSIKGREEDLTPKLLIVGIYNKHPYKTFRDKILLKDEYTEESYDEIIEEEQDGKKIVKVKHVISKSKKPVFEIAGLGNAECKELQENDVLDFVEKLFNGDEELSEVKVFYDSGIQVKKA
ncbi:type I-B CRISPR-associated protein Cas7/Cst2/DevR [Geoglobus acetivorans]|uniref:Type I-B CRISPR-associated protein Cas7/Cst2/DevR n=1 Tax=Geoglobus acetivorans TaxID=565033 RepID=A0ABZ3H5A5_GEOAI|nr:type I-B CRISPR-associated protein Cas7/Cst2/DevR [Geoglobus acetivorans]